MSRFARRKDANHRELAEAFERMGFSVADTSRLGSDFPDAVIAKWHHTALIEIKREDGKLTPGQQRFKREWKGAIFKVSTLEDVQGVAEYFRRWIRNI